MHLSVLHQAVQQRDSGLYSLRFENQDFLLYELKGRSMELSKVDLPTRDSEVLWLCVQFSGALSFPMGSVSQANTIFSFSSPPDGLSLTVPAERVWVLLLGISGVSRQLLLSEYPPLRESMDRMADGLGLSRPISYMDRQQLEQFGRKKFGPFSNLHHIGILIDKMYATYAEKLHQDHDQGSDVALLLLHRKAIDYVKEHFMDADLNRNTIAHALHCSTRSLNRAFEGRTLSLSANILTLRLHKARELLRQQPELTVDRIASMIHFSSTKHFSSQYKKCFYRSPREERKDISSWK